MKQRASRSRRPGFFSLLQKIVWPYRFSISALFTSKPEPENPFVEEPYTEIDLAKYPEKFEKPFECLDMLNAIIIQY